MESKAMQNYQRAISGKDEWLTPPELIKQLGKFDLDPCAPANPPWRTAERQFHIGGLEKDWHDMRVWLNPPYKNAELWMHKMATHGNGIALLFARTETQMFFDHVWSKAHAVKFIKGRLSFYHVSGIKGKPATAPSVLIAYGADNAEVLKNSKVRGKYIDLI